MKARESVLAVLLLAVSLAPCGADQSILIGKWRMILHSLVLVDENRRTSFTTEVPAPLAECVGSVPRTFPVLVDIDISSIVEGEGDERETEVHQGVQGTGGFAA